LGCPEHPPSELPVAAGHLLFRWSALYLRILAGFYHRRSSYPLARPVRLAALSEPTGRAVRPARFPANPPVLPWPRALFALLAASPCVTDARTRSTRRCFYLARSLFPVTMKTKEEWRMPLRLKPCQSRSKSR
jgi:hypothetical protein